MLRIQAADESLFNNSREAWNALVLSMNRPSVFCTWEWIHAWLRILGQSYQPLILFAYKGNTLVGALPLAVKTMRIEDGVIPGRIITFCGSRELYPDHMDIIASAEDAWECLHAAMHYLSVEFRSWDVMHFSHLSDDAALLEYIRSSCPEPEIPHVSLAPYIPIRDAFDGNYEKYMMSLSRNKRHDLRRRNKKLILEDGVLYAADDPKKNPDCIRTLFTLHKMRADSKGIVTTFSGQALQAFHEEIAGIFQDKGWLTLRVMKRGDKVLASLYCFTFAGRVFAYQLGIDPAWEPKGIGSAVLYNMVEEAFQRKCIEFDFLRGGEEYKGSWTEHARSQYTANIYNSSVTGQMIRKSGKMRALAKRWVKG
ncbi:MAG: GNAT family N-acetyltransferase [Syntrophaceae bacterium]|nr:GNAT family N-acetyltransferase [Syntrophaceae bacterium]